MVARGMLFLALLEMLLSSRTVFQFTTRTVLARVVNVPDDESHAINFIDLYPEDNIIFRCSVGRCAPM